MIYPPESDGSPFLIETMERQVSPEPIATATPNLFDEYLIPHDELIEGLDSAKLFYECQSDHKIEYLRRQFDDFTRVMKSVPGFRGSFALGYPFYAIDASGALQPVDEIPRFIEQTKELVEKDRSMALGQWACASCQVVENLPDLKAKCRPCPQAIFKPRDLFKAMPDLDFFAIVDETNDAVEDEIALLLNLIGFYPSDYNIRDSLRDSAAVSKAIAESREPGLRLPLDLHLMTTAEVESALDHITVTPDSAERLLTTPRSWRIGWGNNKVDFRVDFLLSLTEQEWDKKLAAKLAKARTAVKETLGGEGAVETVKQLAPKVAPRLQSAIADILIQRVERW